MSDDQRQPLQTQLLTKVCPRCSVQSQTAAAFCPHCGKAYAGKRRVSGAWVAAIVIVLLVIGGGTGVALKFKRDHAQAAAAQRASDARAAAVAQSAAAKKAADQKAAEQAAADKVQRAQRAALITDMETTINKDAKKDVADALLDGPILGTSCDPLGGGSQDDLTAITTTFECFVSSTKNDDGTESGYNFSATMNWNTGSYTWKYAG